MLDTMILTKTLRVPATPHLLCDEPEEQAGVVARQMDAVLANVGFKATGPLLKHISALPAGVAMDRALLVIGVVRELVGDHVAHNSYFINFPRHVPDTMEFWLSSLRQALVGARVGQSGGVPTDAELMQVVGSGLLNLLALPNYGTYQHSYEEMLAAHEDLVPSVKDRVTFVDLGDTVENEAALLYRQLAGSTVPLGEADLARLETLARHCVEEKAQPESVPVRENRAVINAIRLSGGYPLVGIDTVTDVLRLACQVSGGDVTLRAATPFRTFTRPERRVLMAALEAVVSKNEAKLGDVARYARRWQRLGERVHPGEREFDRYPAARDVFAVARGDKTARSMAAKVELAFAAGDVRLATQRLATAPGMLVRSLDRLLRVAGPGEIGEVISALERVSSQVSGRVLLSLREHLVNRTMPASPPKRVFANRGRRAWVSEDSRVPLDDAAVSDADSVIVEEILRRLPDCDTLVVEDDLRGVALPLSGAASEDGFGVLPRGSVMPVDSETLRLFCYWRQSTLRTDYDLSALFLDEDLQQLGQVSYTNYRFNGAVHSGDITTAAGGATEFIDIPLTGLSASFVVPQVNVYAGETFDEVAEVMFGFMGREKFQKGAPFEPATVRARSAMRGSGRVALPVAFMRLSDGRWLAKWMHLTMPGHVAFNRVEANSITTGLLARSILHRRYTSVELLVNIWARKVPTVMAASPDMELTGPVTYLGLQEPQVPLPEGSTVITASSLNQLIPE